MLPLCLTEKADCSIVLSPPSHEACIKAEWTAGQIDDTASCETALSCLVLTRMKPPNPCFSSLSAKASWDAGWRCYCAPTHQLSQVERRTFVGCCASHTLWVCREKGIVPPAVEPLNIEMLPDDVLLPVGRVSAIVGPTIVVQV